MRSVGGRRAWAAGLPEAVETMASALAAGLSLVDGLAAASAAASGDLAEELAAVVARVDRGMSVAEAVGRWGVSGRTPGAGLVAAAVGLAADAGGDPRHALLRVAVTLRERRSLERELRALSSQARASAALVAAAPALFLAFTVVADPTTARWLLGSPGGWACVAGGACLDLAGWRWMRRLTRSVG
jgi:tight adherence protein B